MLSTGNSAALATELLRSPGRTDPQWPQQRQTQGSILACFPIFLASPAPTPAHWDHFQVLGSGFHRNPRIRQEDPLSPSAQRGQSSCRLPFCSLLLHTPIPHCSKGPLLSSNLGYSFVHSPIWSQVCELLTHSMGPGHGKHRAA